MERWALVAGVTGCTANGLLLALYTVALPGNHDYDRPGPANDVIGAVSGLTMIPLARGVRDLLGSPGKLPLLTGAVAVGAMGSAIASGMLVTGQIEFPVQGVVGTGFAVTLLLWTGSAGRWGGDDQGTAAAAGPSRSARRRPGTGGAAAGSRRRRPAARLGRAVRGGRGRCRIGPRGLPGAAGAADSALAGHVPPTGGPSLPQRAGAMSVLFGPLSLLWTRLGPRPYDAMYRRGAPWDTGPRAELVALLESGRLTTAIGPRALDVGCGTGADCRLLAGHGFDVIGVDFSAAAVGRARAAGGAPRYVLADVFALPSEVTGEPFDLIFDGGTIDDLPPAGQRKAAGIVTSLARPGSVLVMWCFSVHREDAPWFSLNGPSRLGGMGITPDQVRALFGAHWDIEHLPTANPAERAACYWMTRRSAAAGPGGAP